MPDSTRLLLRRSLVDGYAELKRRLARRLGSSSMATEVLNETWLRLGQGGKLDQVDNPQAYVYRVALNTAGSLRRRSEKHENHIELTEAHDLSDDAPLADRILSAREEVELIRQALTELPERQREAFLQCFRGDTLPEELAKRYRVSVRTIQADIRNAILHCAEKTGRKKTLAGRRVRVSRK